MNEFGITRFVGAAMVAASLCWNLPAQDTSESRTARPDTTLIQDLDRPGQPVRVSTRWIGVVCSPADDLLRAHLDLPEGAGLVVQSIIPGSPAEQAGLHQHDILMSVAGTPLTGLEQLVEAVESSEGNPMEFTWLRKGKAMTESIAPALRPTEMKWTPDEEGAGWTPDVDTEALQQWVEKFKRDPRGNQPFALRFFGPGITPEGEAEEFTGSLSVEIQKAGDQPARITVRRGDETWDVTEETLDQLPGDLQGRVEGMLGKGGRVGTFQVIPGDGNALRLEDLQRLRDLHVPRMDMPPAFQQQFDEMHRRMEEMMRQLHELREREEPNDNGDVDA